MNKMEALLNAPDEVVEDAFIHYLMGCNPGPTMVGEVNGVMMDMLPKSPPHPLAQRLQVALRNLREKRWTLEEGPNPDGEKEAGNTRL
jgi:hypothetical protein